MKTTFKIVGILGGIIGVFAIIFLIILFSTFPDMCGNRIARTIESPKKGWKIVVFERDCGATTDFSTQISILRANQELRNEAGNIFTADSGRGNAETSKYGLIYVEPHWLNSRTILIKYDSMATVYEQEDSFNGITIKYEKVKRGT